MKEPPSYIKSFLFDLLLSCATLFIGGIISFIICIALTGSREEGMGIGVFITIPISSTIFYIIRRRFNFQKTLIQIILTSVFTYGLTFLWIKLLDYLPDYYSYETGYLIIIIACLAFTLTKHVSDKLILILRNRSN